MDIRYFLVKARYFLVKETVDEKLVELVYFPTSKILTVLNTPQDNY